MEMPADEYRVYNWGGRLIKHHRATIRAFLKIREATAQDVRDLTLWLYEKIVSQQRQMEALLEAVYGRCRTQHIEPPSEARLQRLIHAALVAYDKQLCLDCLKHLTPEMRKQLDGLITVVPSREDPLTTGRSMLHELRLDPGGLSLDTIQSEMAKLERIRACDLSQDQFQKVSLKVLENYEQCGRVEELHKIKRHLDALRYTLLAAFCWVRRQEIIDSLAELLIDTVHHIKHARRDAWRRAFSPIFDASPARMSCRSNSRRRLWLNRRGLCVKCFTRSWAKKRCAIDLPPKN
jgi:hypothetical protein